MELKKKSQITWIILKKNEINNLNKIFNNKDILFLINKIKVASFIIINIFPFINS